MDLPKGHWIHGAMAKEKARVGKKGAAGKKAARKGGTAPMGNGQPDVSANASSGDGYGPASEHQQGSAGGYTC